MAACGSSTATRSSGGDASAHGAAVPGAAGAGGALKLGSAGGSSQASGRSVTETASLAARNESIIYTASMTVRASSVAGAANRAVGITSAAGGYTADEHKTSTTPDHTGQTISLTLKIPVPVFQKVLAELSAPAEGKQLSLQQQATDVTQEVANVASLVTSEQDAIAALQKLLGRAASVAGLLSVQRQISADESTLNSLQAQQRALDRETTYATITMTLLGPRHQEAPPRKPGRRGFLAGLTSGWRAFRHAVTWVLTALGALLPFLVAIVVLGAGSYAGWRRMRRRARPAAVPDQP